MPKKSRLAQILSSDSVTEHALHVYLYFPISGGWRIKEIVPTVRELKPMHELPHMWDHFGQMWNGVTPVLAGATALSRIVPTPVTELFLVMSVFAKLHINTVPPEAGFNWSVDKVTCFSKEYGLMHGTRWNIPKKMFHKLGGRLTGSLAVCFIPSMKQSEKERDRADSNKKADLHLEWKPILAKAVLDPLGESPITLPDLKDRDEFIKLFIRPYEEKTTIIKSLLKKQQSPS